MATNWLSGRGTSTPTLHIVLMASSGLLLRGPSACGAQHRRAVRPAPALARFGFDQFCARWAFPHHTLGQGPGAKPLAVRRSVRGSGPEPPPCLRSGADRLAAEADVVEFESEHLAHPAPRERLVGNLCPLIQRLRACTVLTPGWASSATPSYCSLRRHEGLDRQAAGGDPPQIPRPTLPARGPPSGLRTPVRRSHMYPIPPFRHAPALTLLYCATALAGCGSDNGSGPAGPSPAPAAFAETPATGNGQKLVIPVDAVLPSVDCGGGQVLQAHIHGWIQVRVFDQTGSRNVELDVFHNVITFTNLAGETYAWHDVGPDHYYLDRDGNLIVASSGRIGGGLIGHVVTNLTTGEVEFVAGKEFPGVESLACAALT
jgi:hypothetical protein